MGKFSNYYGYVSDEADSFVSEHIDELIGDIKDGDTDVDTFVNDYRVHEWVDNDFIYVDLIDSAEIIESSDNVETDSGLWEGQEPKDAIQTQAFFTYRTDLSIAVKEIIEGKLQDKIDELEGELSDVDGEIKELEAEDELDEEQEDELEELEEKQSELQEFIDNLQEAIDSL